MPDICFGDEFCSDLGEVGCEVQLVAAVEEGGDVGAVAVVNDRSRRGRAGGSKVVGRGEFLVTFC